MDDEERLEEVDSVLEDLATLAEDHIILIEGLKDRRALNYLGIGGKMFQIQSEGGPLKAAEYVSEHGGKAVILTDWDRKGGAIAADLITYMESLGLKYDVSIRMRLSVLCKKYIKDVESLDSLVDRLSKNTGMKYG